MADVKEEQEIKHDCRYNKASFKKLYGEYAENLKLNTMNRKNKFNASHWYTCDAKYLGQEYKIYLDKDKAKLTAVYSIRNGNVNIYSLNEMQLTLMKQHFNLDSDEKLLRLGPRVRD